jgi:hypothetical protein
MTHVCHSAHDASAGADSFFGHVILVVCNEAQCLMSNELTPNLSQVFSSAPRTMFSTKVLGRSLYWCLQLWYSTGDTLVFSRGTLKKVPEERNAMHSTQCHSTFLSTHLTVKFEAEFINYAIYNISSILQRPGCKILAHTHTHLYALNVTV